MRTAFRILASLTSLAIVFQVGFAGYGAFNAVNLADDGKATKHAVENGFDPHGIVGTIVGVLIILTLLAALFGVRERVRIASILFVLGVVQFALAAGADAASWVGFFHGANALALAGVAGSLAGDEWKRHRIASPV